MLIITSPSSSLSFSASSIFLPTPKFLLPSATLKPSPRITTPRSSPKTLTLTLIRASTSSLPILSFSGDKIGEALLDLKSAPPDTARAIVHRAIIAEQQNQRRGTASTLTRGEVRGGGKKPYPQKKTGHARRGSQRTPLRPGGGVIFGPKPKDWSIKINRKERRLAFSTAIASAASSSDALVVEDFSDQFEARPKTKEFIAAMRRWGLDPKEKSLFLMTEVPDNVKLSCRNIGSLKMLTPRTLNLFDILDSAKLVLTKSAVKYLNSMYGEGAAEVDDVEEDEVGEQATDAEADITQNWPTSPNNRAFYIPIVVVADPGSHRDASLEVYAGASGIDDDNREDVADIEGGMIVVDFNGGAVLGVCGGY